MNDYERSTASSSTIGESTSVAGGLFDRLSFPDQLAGHVVDPHGTQRAIAGYAVETGLSVKSDFLATAWLALTGELPSPAQHHALSAALILLAPLHAGESPVHAAIVARVAACADESIGGIVATALGQWSKSEIDLVDALAQAMADDDGRGDVGAVPAAFVASNDDERTRYAALTARSATWFDAPLPRSMPLNRIGSAYALLIRLQQREAIALQAWSLLARVAVVFGEARHTAPGSVTRYPTRTPEYIYVEDAS